MHGLEDSPVDMAKLKASIALHEGLRLKPYKDTVGKITIGVGRNLTDKGITNDEALYMLGNDIRSAIGEAEAQAWWAKVKDSDPRARALIELIFNLGLGGLKNFTHALAAIDSGNYALAADEFLNSKWARQVGQRAVTLTRMIRTGSDPQAESEA